MTPKPPRRAMWIAIECSVTVSMGDETRGVLRLIRLVTGASRATSEAAKPSIRDQQASPRPWRLGSTNVARKHEEIIIC